MTGEKGKKSLAGSKGSAIVKAQTGAITKGKHISGTLQFNYGVAANKLIPPNVQAMMANMFKSVGLNFDINQLDLTDRNFNQKVAEIKSVVQIISTNTKLLPDLHKHLASAMSSAADMANFQADTVISSLTSQHKIDEAQARVLLALAGFGQKRNKLEEKTLARIQKIKQMDEIGHRDRQITYARQVELLHMSAELVREVNNKKVKSDETIRAAKSLRQQEEINYLEAARI